jgi:hypothetical protein
VKADVIGILTKDTGKAPRNDQANSGRMQGKRRRFSRAPTTEVRSSDEDCKAARQDFTVPHRSPPEPGQAVPCQSFIEKVGGPCRRDFVRRDVVEELVVHGVGTCTFEPAPKQLGASG